MEGSRYPEIALPSAERITNLLPSSGHIVHMPSHIYILMGDFHKAAEVNEKAVALDREYIKAFGSSGTYPVHYMSHNLFFLSRAFILEGRYDDAKKAAIQLAQFYNPFFMLMPSLEFYATAPLIVDARFHRWDSLVRTPPPEPPMTISNAFWYFGRAFGVY